MGENAEMRGGEQFEIGLFMDFSQFEELEQKVLGIIERLKDLRSRNEELQEKVRTLEAEIQQQATENKRLLSQCEELRDNQRDAQKEELVRKKYVAELDPLKNWPPGSSVGFSATESPDTVYVPVVVPPPSGPAKIWKRPFSLNSRL